MRSLLDVSPFFSSLVSLPQPLCIFLLNYLSLRRSFFLSMARVVLIHLIMNAFQSRQTASKINEKSKNVGSPGSACVEITARQWNRTAGQPVKGANCRSNRACLFGWNARNWTGSGIWWNFNFWCTLDNVNLLSLKMMLNWSEFSAQKFVCLIRPDCTESV